MFQFHVRLAAVLLLTAWATSLPADDAAKDRPGIAFRLAELENAADLTKAVAPGDGKTVFLHAKSVLTDKDVTSVSFARDESGLVNVTLQIEAEAAKRLAAATKSHIGKPLAILLDDKVITAPVVRSEISASAQISGNFSDADLLRMFSALVLHSESSAKEKAAVK
jgi:preprotein translocase subunit SecD